MKFSFATLREGLEIRQPWWLTQRRPARCLAGWQNVAILRRLSLMPGDGTGNDSAAEHMTKMFGPNGRRREKALTKLLNHIFLLNKEFTGNINQDRPELV